KCSGKAEGGLPRQRGVAAIKGGLNGLAEDVTVKIGVLSQYPQVEIILHSTVGDAKRGQRFDLFGHDCVGRIGTQLGSREPGQHNGVLDILRTGRDSVAESDVDLDPAACAVDHTE